MLKSVVHGSNGLSSTTHEESPSESDTIEKCSKNKKKKKRKCSVAMIAKKRAQKLREYIAKETADKREARLAYMREMAKARRQSESQEERERRLQNLRDNQKSRIKKRQRLLNSIKKIDEPVNNGFKIDFNKLIISMPVSNGSLKIGKVNSQLNMIKNSMFLKYRDSIIACMDENETNCSLEPFIGFNSLSSDVVMASAHASYFNRLINKRSKSKLSVKMLDNNRNIKSKNTGDSEKINKTFQSSGRRKKSLHSLQSSDLTHDKKTCLICQPLSKDKQFKREHEQSESQLNLSVCLEKMKNSPAIVTYHPDSRNNSPTLDHYTKDQDILNLNENIKLCSKSHSEIIVGSSDARHNGMLELECYESKNNNGFNERNISERIRVSNHCYDRSKNGFGDENKNINYSEETSEKKLHDLEMTNENKVFRLPTSKSNFFNVSTNVVSYQMSDSKSALFESSQTSLKPNVVSQELELPIKKEPKIILKPLTMLM